MFHRFRLRDALHVTEPSVDRVQSGELRVTISPDVVQREFGIGRHTTLYVYFVYPGRGRWVFHRMEEESFRGSVIAPEPVNPPALWSAPMQEAISYAVRFLYRQERPDADENAGLIRVDDRDLPDDRPTLIDDGGEENLSLARTAGARRRPA